MQLQSEPKDPPKVRVEEHPGWVELLPHSKEVIEARVEWTEVCSGGPVHLAPVWPTSKFGPDPLETVAREEGELGRGA